MYKTTIFILFVFFFACQNNSTKISEKEFPKTEKGDKIIHITTINSAEDTLFQIRNATKGTLKIYYKGDSIFLLQDSVSFSNKTYTLTEQNGETTFTKNNKILFQNPKR